MYVDIVWHSEAIIDGLVVEGLENKFIQEQIDEAHVDIDRVGRTVHARHEDCVGLVVRFVRVLIRSLYEHEQPWLIRHVVDILEISLLVNPHSAFQVFRALVGINLILAPWLIVKQVLGLASLCFLHRLAMSDTISLGHMYEEFVLSRRFKGICLDA
jgi:hypothetical protein